MDKQHKKILVTVKTYPFLSYQHEEVVCTAGLLEDGSWIRLYPVRYRYIREQYRKYQWIEVDVIKHRGDKRKESYMPVGTITLGRNVGTSDGWAERIKHVLARGTRSMCELNHRGQFDISLAIIKPKQVIDLEWRETSKTWKPRQLEFFRQQNLFMARKKPLEKIPYIFSYRFLCQAPDCKSHVMMIEDWEIMELYRKMRDRYGELDGLVKVKQRFFGQMCSPKRDTYFFVGTHFVYGTWIILGVFWPPRR